MVYNEKCKNLTFNECEVAILRAAVDEAGEVQGAKKANSPKVKKIIDIVEQFIKDKGLVIYGGEAINRLMPDEDKFYNRDADIPDFDFYSTNALHDAKELVDIYVKKGYIEVEAKSGQHHKTYKVFVNFIPVADITFMDKELFKAIKKDSIVKDGIQCAPANLLRMGMYLELSRPGGDVSRWEKVMKRLILLNKNYPLKADCNHVNFQRNMDKHYSKIIENKIFTITRDTFIKEKVVFFGGYALSLYAKYMPKDIKHRLKHIPDFDVLSEEPLKTANKVKEELEKNGIHNVSVVKQKNIGELISTHYEIIVNKNDIIAIVYEPLACHSYNVINSNFVEYKNSKSESESKKSISKKTVMKNKKTDSNKTDSKKTDSKKTDSDSDSDSGKKEPIKGIRIATIDTMLSFYLAFLYADRDYFDNDRILCMSSYLFKVQAKNRLEQKGVLKRFSINCLGHQETLEEMRALKAKKFMELKDKKGTEEYDEWFLRYRPLDKTINNNKKKSKSVKNKSVKSKSVKNKSKSKSVKNKSVKNKSVKSKSVKNKSVKSKSVKSKYVKSEKDKSVKSEKDKSVKSESEKDKFDKDKEYTDKEDKSESEKDKSDKDKSESEKDKSDKDKSDKNKSVKDKYSKTVKSESDKEDNKDKRKGIITKIMDIF